MIDIQQAKERVSARLDAYAAAIGSPVHIVEAEIEEHEWGWVIWCEPADRSRMPVNRRNLKLNPYVVDRVTGRVEHVRSSGVTAAVMRLFSERDKQ